MRTFDEVVNEIAKEGYGWRLADDELKKVFESLSSDVHWRGTYWGWQEQKVWEEVCEAVHKYMLENRSE